MSIRDRQRTGGRFEILDRTGARHLNSEAADDLFLLPLLPFRGAFVHIARRDGGECRVLRREFELHHDGDDTAVSLVVWCADVSTPRQPAFVPIQFRAGLERPQRRYRISYLDPPSAHTEG